MVNKKLNSDANTSPLYAYDVPAHRIKALASADLSGMKGVMVLSPKRLKGLPTRKLKQITLAGGKKAVAIDASPGRQVALPSGDVVQAEAFTPDARARAILRGRDYAEADLRDAGGAFDLEQVRTLLHGVSRQAVEKRVREGSVIAVPGPGHKRSYPTFQFLADGTVVDGLRDVQAALPTRNPWIVLGFLANPQSALSGQTGMARLKAGDISTVVAAARTVGEQGA